MNVTGDPDLYVNYGSAPTAEDWLCRPFNSDNTDELCSIYNPQAGTWHVMIIADDPFSGANFNANTQ